MFSFVNNNPDGTCIALPRSTGNTISLLGIICMGKVSSNACFWDNQNDDKVAFEIDKGTVVPLTEFAGGADLYGGTGGPCTACHAGENPFIIHPDTALDLTLAGINLQTDKWYDPIVDNRWALNPGPTNILANIPSTGNCLVCHTKGEPGGRFPHLSSELEGYCGILKQAFERTMPPPSDPPKDKDTFLPQTNVLTAACRLASVNLGRNMELDVDRPGSDYRNFQITERKPSLCEDACRGDVNCKAWTYVKPGVQTGSLPHCWLKNGIPDAKPSSCCVSGLRHMEYETDRPGSDFQNFDLSEPDPYLCQKSCDDNSQCKAWTYVKPDIQGDNARCWLKDDVRRARADKCCISGVKKMEYDTDRGGSDYSNFFLAIADPAECQQRCNSDGQCRAWTYVKPGVQGSKARCWLKNAVPGARANACCMSGRK